MKNRALLLSGLLVTSLVSNGMLYRQFSARSGPPAQAGVEAASTQAASLRPHGPPLPSWTEVDGEPPQALAERLRSQDLPEKMVAALTTASVVADFDARRRAALAAEPGRYWSQRFLMEASGGPAVRALSRELTQAVRAALGAEAMTASFSPEARLQQERLYGPLPVAKIAALQEITGDYAEMRQAIQAEAGQLLLAEDREKLDLIAQEEQRDLKALLTPEEYLEYQLRRSSAASQVRSQLQGVEVTEAEFRQLYQLQQGFLDQYGSRSTAANAADRRAADQQLLTDVKALLGPERGTEYEANRDFGYRQLKALTTRLELPASTATEVYSLQRDLQQRASRIRGTPGLAPAERTAQLDALVSEAATALSGKLGADGYSAYQQTAAGSWLRTLNPGSNAARGTPSSPTLNLR